MENLYKKYEKKKVKSNNNCLNTIVNNQKFTFSCPPQSMIYKKPRKIISNTQSFSKIKKKI